MDRHGPMGPAIRIGLQIIGIRSEEIAVFDHAPVFLHTGAGYGNVQADQVLLRLPAGDVFGEAQHMSHLRNKGAMDIINNQR